MSAHTIPSNRAIKIVFLAMILTLAAGACVPKKTAQDVPPSTAHQAVDPDALDVDTAYSEGLSAFWSGDYASAAALFESMARRLDDQMLRAKALYGVACSRLAGARSEEEFRAAKAVWQEWELASSGNVHQADPRMITPFLMNPKLFPPAVREAKPQAARPNHADQDLAKRLQEKEKEVLNLQKQIKALEAIHREIQAKKKMTQ
ncbi:MAG: hypothetical protein ACOZEN_04590 [Thermodesulfobacteriota bacterium]